MEIDNGIDSMFLKTKNQIPKLLNTPRTKTSHFTRQGKIDSDYVTISPDLVAAQVHNRHVFIPECSLKIKHSLDLLNYFCSAIIQRHEIQSMY